MKMAPAQSHSATSLIVAAVIGVGSAVGILVGATTSTDHAAASALSGLDHACTTMHDTILMPQDAYEAAGYDPQHPEQLPAVQHRDIVKTCG